MPAKRDRHRRRGQSWDQAKAAKATVWARVHWSERTDLGRRLDLLKGRFRGVTAKAALGLVRLQARFYGAVIADGKKIARAAGISESAWWHWARPELEQLEFMRTVERGGGRLKGGDGHANVYMSPDAGEQAAPPRGAPAPAPPTPSEAAVDEDAVARRARIREQAELAHARTRDGPGP
jgi:hypothetical protein